MDYPPEVKGHPLLELAWQSANLKNSNFIVFINGLPGSGKSTLAQDMMFLLDRGNDYGFRCELKNWCLTQKDFVKAINRNIGDVGRCITWEEPYSAGIKDGGANARNFQKHTNLQISTIFQTMRRNNHIILLTLPANASFDKQARMMAHAIVYVRKNNGYYGSARVYLRDYNPVFDIENHPFQRVKTSQGFVRIKNLYFGLPPKSWMDACNEKSDDYKLAWSKEIEKYKKIDRTDVRRSSQNKMLFFEKVKVNSSDYKRIFRNKEVWNYGKIAKEFRTDYSSATHWVRELEG